MEQEYKTSLILKIIYGGCAICIWIICVYNSLIIAKGNFVFPCIVSLIIVLIIINLYRRKLIISENSISYISIWGSRFLFITDIKGYRTSKNAIHIYPISGQFSKLSVRDKYSLEDYDGFMLWIIKNLKDLDLIDYERDENEIISSVNTNLNIELRQDKYENAKIYSVAYNIIASVLLILSVMLQIESIFLKVILLIYPFLGLLLIVYTKGIVRIFAKLESSAYRSIYLGLFLIQGCLIVDSVRNTTIFNYDNLNWQVIIAGLLFLIVSLIAIFNFAIKVFWSQLFFALTFAVGYGYGSVLEVNYSFDTSTPPNISSTVIDHDVIQNKSTSYDITLNRWGYDKRNEKISVNNYQYNTIKIGDSVRIYLKQGYLHI